MLQEDKIFKGSGVNINKKYFFVFIYSGLTGKPT